LESAPTGIVIIDAEGRIKLVNVKALEMFGYQEDELVGQTMETLLPERFRQVHPMHRTGFVREPQNRPMGTDLNLFGQRKDGSEFPVEVGLSYVKLEASMLLMSYISDITERKAAENQLRKLSRAVEQSPSTVVITNTSGEMEYVNPKFVEITGYLEGEVLGRNPRILKSGKQAPGYYQELWDTVLNGGEWRGEFSNRRKDGTIYWESASISPIKSAEGETTHFVKVAEDITEQKRANAEMRKYAAELEARNEELDAFAHTVAHDLKNPLNLILGFAEFLKVDTRTVLDVETREYLGLIARSGRKMSNIIDELLLLAGVRKVDAPLAPVDMADVVIEAQHRVHDMIEESKAEIGLPDAWPWAMGYAPWIEEVWVNYLSNALKYGGRPPRVEMGAEEQADGMVRFWVRDNGRGITAGDQAKLFAPFKQLDQTRAQGHGLGLSIVRRIVEKLGGQVGVESEGIPGQGSIFHFSLPAVTTEGRGKG
jgi:PAS domain S-box-containing protein